MGPPYTMAPPYIGLKLNVAQSGPVCIFYTQFLQCDVKEYIREKNPINKIWSSNQELSCVYLICTLLKLYAIHWSKQMLKQNISGRYLNQI